MSSFAEGARNAFLCKRNTRCIRLWKAHAMPHSAEGAHNAFLCRRDLPCLSEQKEHAPSKYSLRIGRLAGWLAYFPYEMEGWLVGLPSLKGTTLHKDLSELEGWLTGLLSIRNEGWLAGWPPLIKGNHSSEGLPYEWFL